MGAVATRILVVPEGRAGPGLGTLVASVQGGPSLQLLSLLSSCRSCSRQAPIMWTHSCSSAMPAVSRRTRRWLATLLVQWDPLVHVGQPANGWPLALTDGSLHGSQWVCQGNFKMMSCVDSLCALTPLVILVYTLASAAPNRNSRVNGW